MSSQKAKELRALALSLSLVNDDLQNKRFLRKSEFYKESDRYKMERRAQQLAAMNLSNELKNVSPAVAGVLVNAVNNAPPEIVGHAGDGEIKEGDFKNRMSASDEDLKEVIRNLQKEPEQRVLSDEMIDKKIDSIITSAENAVNISNEELDKMNERQTQTLLELYKMQEDSFDDLSLSEEAEKAIERHVIILNNRMKIFNKQKEAEVEAAERKIAEPTKAKLTRKPTPPAAPAPTTKRGPGRPPGVKNKPKTEEVVEKQFMKDTGKTKRGRPKKKVEGETKPPPIVIERTSEAPTAIEGEGFKDYMAYMKGRKPTKKMKKLILLIGSKRAGNNSHKLNVEIEKLIADLRQDLQGKISKHKAKSARKQASAVAREKKMIQIREAAKKQMDYEKSLAQY